MQHSGLEITPRPDLPATVARCAAAISATSHPEQGYQTALFTDEATACHWLAQ
ncbi:hypothetical protein GCM10028822_33620 [Hymenobacter terrigena]